jgi:hypothetical protein
MRIVDIENFIMNTRTAREAQEILDSIRRLRDLLPSQLEKELDLGALESVVKWAGIRLVKKEAEADEERSEARRRAIKILEYIYPDLEPDDTKDFMRYNRSFNDRDLPDGWVTVRTGQGRYGCYTLYQPTTYLNIKNGTAIVENGQNLVGVWEQRTATERSFLGYFLTRLNLFDRESAPKGLWKGVKNE